MVSESEPCLILPLLPRFLEDILGRLSPSLGVGVDSPQRLDLYDEKKTIFLFAIGVSVMRQQDVVGESIVHAPQEAMNEWVLGPAADSKALDGERCAPCP